MDAEEERMVVILDGERFVRSRCCLFGRDVMVLTRMY